MGNIDIGGRLHSTATGNVVAGANEILDDSKNKKQSEINTETYSLVNDINERLDGLSPEQQSALSVSAKATNNETKLGYYVCDTEGNVAAKVISDATGYVLSLGGSIKVKMTNANTVNNATLNINSTGAKALYYSDERASANNSWEAGETVEVYYDGTSFYANSVAGGSSDGVFDLTAKTSDTYATLNDAITAANTVIPVNKKKGGMSIKYVQTSDNMYVQYRLMLSTFTTAQFTNPANWQGVDEEPTLWSQNMAKSGGIKDAINTLSEDVGFLTDINIDSIPLKSYMLGSTNWYSGGQHIVIPVRQGYTYFIKGTSAAKGYVGWLTSEYVQPTGASEIPYVSGTTRMQPSAAGDYYVVPEGAAYLCFNRKEYSLNYTYDIKCYKTASVIKIIEDVNSSIEEVTEETVVNNVVQGSIYAGEQIEDESCLCSSLYYKVKPGQVINIVRASDIKIRINEYKANKVYYAGGWNPYAKIDTYTTSSKTEYVRISASYSERANKVTTSDYVEGDFGIIGACPIYSKEAFDTLHSLENTIKEVQSDVASNTNDIDDLNRIIFGNKQKEKTKIVNLLSDATHFYTQGGYDCYYIAVNKGDIVKTIINCTEAALLRIATSSAVPAADVACTSFTTKTVPVGVIDFNYQAEENGYLAVSIYGSSYDSFEFIKASDGLVKDVETLKEEVENITTGMFLYCEAESMKTINNGTVVTMSDYIAVPHDNAKIKIVCPSDIVVWFKLYKDPYDSTNVTTSYAENGDTVVLNAGYCYYNIMFAYGSKSSLSGKAINVSDITSLLESGRIALSYEEKDVVTNNKDIEKAMMSQIRTKTGGNSLPVFVHVSDVHGDAIRYLNAYKMAEHIDATALVNTGDSVMTNIGDGYGFLSAALRLYPSVNTLFCTGNHDASNNADDKSRYYNYFITSQGYTASAAGTYYYKDYADKLIRVISLNLYEDRHWEYRCRISKTQIDWLIATLGSTPANYGVIIMAHCMEMFTVKDTQYGKFYDDSVTPSWGTRYEGITGNPVSHIVDAFISKTSISGSYTNTILQEGSTTETEEETVSYSADFANINSGVEFICYMNGHDHRDIVGYLEDTTNPQLNLNIGETAAVSYFNNEDDYPRNGGKGSVGDAFNVYAIDRTNKTVRVIRIGSNKTYDFSDRDFMIIPYAES